ncbi:MAG: large repetitive protein, partial [Verrucomicrobiota bacterium]
MAVRMHFATRAHLLPRRIPTGRFHIPNYKLAFRAWMASIAQPILRIDLSPMKTSPLYLALFALLNFVAASGAQTVLSIDFNERVADQTTNTANNAAGFDSFLINSNTSITAVQTAPSTRVFGGVTVAVAGVGTAVTYDDRLRALPVNSGAFTLGAVFRDFIFNPSAANGDGLGVTVDGLTAGQFYKVTIWSYDNSSTGNRVSDWTANNAVVKSAYVFNGSTLPTSDNDNKFSFKIAADGTGRVVVQGRRNAATSSAGSVFINALQMEVTTPDPPTVSVPPAGSTVYAGDNPPAFTIQASGAAPFFYQWRKTGADISGATNLSLTLSNAQAADAADYSCVVTNAGGSVTSIVAHLTVLPVVD